MEGVVEGEILSVLSVGGVGAARDRSVIRHVDEELTGGLVWGERRGIIPCAMINELDCS